MSRTRPKNRQGFSFQKQRALELASIETALHQPPRLVAGAWDGANSSLLTLVFDADMDSAPVPDVSRILVDGNAALSFDSWLNSRCLRIAVSPLTSSGPILLLAGSNIYSTSAQGHVEVAAGVAAYVMIGGA